MGFLFLLCKIIFLVRKKKVIEVVVDFEVVVGHEGVDVGEFVDFVEWGDGVGVCFDEG